MICHGPLTHASRSFLLTVLLLLFAGWLTPSAFAQSATANLTGTIVDQNGAVVPGVNVTISNTATGLQRQVVTNEEGYFIVPSLPPANYSLTTQRDGFAPIQIKNIVLNVGDQKTLQIQLKAGDVNATVQVTSEAPLINESPAVGTTVDRQFVENIPLNGRSFQSLIELTPGVVTTPTTFGDGGQFSVNGQRPSANYWMVDGVGANIGTGVSSTGNAGNGLAGSLGSFSALGGTNSLVSVDAMQEFHIQTSTYAPEFGRTPGAQISIATRSGTNQFHGTAFDYLRNDKLDANDWFANRAGLTKPRERQNDFGGTFSGPIIKSRTFFFFSYEGLRLRLPATSLTTVPDLLARQAAVTAMQPLLNSFPLPNGTDNTTTGVAQFNASYSNPGTLDATSIRIDHQIGNKMTLFGRYNNSPSETSQRGGSAPLNNITLTRITTQTLTLGSTWNVSATTVNDLRFNYSKTSAAARSFQDNFGGAVPIASLPSVADISQQDTSFGLFVTGLTGGFAIIGPTSHNFQHQINITDSVNLQRASHGLKLGIDYRRLSPQFSPLLYGQTAVFSGVNNAKNGTVALTTVQSGLGATFLFRDLGIYGQDTWRLSSRVTLTYGLRWDIGFVPKSIRGPSFPAVTGFDLNNMSQLALASAGTPPFATKYGNVAPRVGISFQLRQSPKWQTVVRGGFGVFYDLASSEMGNQIGLSTYPFGASKRVIGGGFPLSATNAAPPAIAAPPAATSGVIRIVDPKLKSPHTLEWNVALEQSLGQAQVISASYVGAAGRNLLLSTQTLSALNATIPSATVVTNAGTSDYHALQVQFRRRLTQGLQALASYTWSHSIDTGSAGSTALNTNVFVPSAIAGSNRGASDFDIRHGFSAAITYDIPRLKSNSLAKAVLGDWSLDNIFQARSAPPVTISTGFNAFTGGINGSVRPDIVAGQPFYLLGPQYPGGKALNPAAFTNPPVDAVTKLPTRQGTAPRNFLRGFGAAEWDFAIHRNFHLHESLGLQFRAEMFNVLNHPNFGQPVGSLSSGTFGLSQAMLNKSLTGSGSAGSGGFNSLYQIGGPRSIQLGLKLIF